MLSLRTESLENIQSEEGIILRKNRSIQVEGAFGVLKQDYGFRKFLTRGKVHVTVEMLLYVLDIMYRNYIIRFKVIVVDNNFIQKKWLKKLEYTIILKERNVLLFVVLKIKSNL